MPTSIWGGSAPRPVLIGLVYSCREVGEGRFTAQINVHSGYANSSLPNLHIYYSKIHFFQPTPQEIERLVHIPDAFLMNNTVKRLCMHSSDPCCWLSVIDSNVSQNMLTCWTTIQRILSVLCMGFFVLFCFLGRFFA